MHTLRIQKPKRTFKIKSKKKSQKHGLLKPAAVEKHLSLINQLTKAGSRLKSRDVYASKISLSCTITPVSKLSPQCVSPIHAVGC